MLLTDASLLADPKRMKGKTIIEALLTNGRGHWTTSGKIGKIVLSS